MNLYHLRYFVTLAHLEHYTKAAEQLSITQPSLSHAIASLESELKLQLFQKDGRNIVLTKSGHSFLNKVEKILAQLDSAVSEMQMSENTEGTLDIAFVRFLGVDFIPTLLQEYKNVHPDKNIQFRLHNGGGLSATILEGLKAQKYDVAFCSKYKNDPLLDFTPVASQELVIIVSNNHPLAKYDSIDLKETLKYPQIAFHPRSGLRGVIDEMYESIGAHPRIAMEVEEDQVIAGMVARDFGIAVVPRMHVLDHLDVKVLSIASPKPSRIFYLVTLKNAYRTVLSNDFIKFAEAHEITLN